MRYFITIVISSLLLVGCKGKKSEAPADPDIYYTCSMDPQVVEYKPGKCPICHMELTPVRKSTGKDKEEIQLSASQLQLGNIQYDTIRTGAIGEKIVLTATLNFDQLKTRSVSSRVAGRIEKLYFKNPGELIRRGEKLFDVYSEELNNAKQEYILALEKRETLGNSLIDFDRIIQSAKNKLLLWGLSEAQINELAVSRKSPPVTSFYSPAGGTITSLEIKEGDYIMEGGTIVKLADLSTLWAEAQVYASQLSGIDRNGSVIVQIPDLANREIAGKIEFVNPEINPDTRINLFRVTIPDRFHDLKPGMPAYVFLKSREKISLTLPIDAVIRDSKGATVWVKTGTHSFKSRMVETGLETGERIEIRTGLQPGDVVVIKGAYLLNSEYIFKKGSDPMAGHDMNKMSM